MARTSGRFPAMPSQAQAKPQGDAARRAVKGDLTIATRVLATMIDKTIFAVSPDDQRIAVVQNTYNASGATTVLYAEDLNGGTNHVKLFTQTGAFTLWPIGWHGTNDLVLAKVPSCTQGGGPTCCGPQELHVVDPATAGRRSTLGGRAASTGSGAP